VQPLTTVTPGGSLHPFGLGQIWNPYPGHYSPAFAFSTILYPLLRRLPLRVACRLPILWKVGRGSGLPRSLWYRRGE